MSYTVFDKELALIANNEVRSTVEAILVLAPDQFWYMPASSSGKYHAADECLPCGNVLHTKRVVAMVRMLAPAYGVAGVELDYCMAAALIHDILKGGAAEGDLKFTAKCSRAEYERHGPNLLLWYQDVLGFIAWPADAILDIASRHMGVWSPVGYQPDDKLSQLVAMADYVASRKPLAPAIPLAE